MEQEAAAVQTGYTLATKQYYYYALLNTFFRVHINANTIRYMLANNI